MDGSDGLVFAVFALMFIVRIEQRLSSVEDGLRQAGAADEITKVFGKSVETVMIRGTAGMVILYMLVLIVLKVRELISLL